MNKFNGKVWRDGWTGQDYLNLLTYICSCLKLVIIGRFREMSFQITLKSFKEVVIL